MESKKAQYDIVYIKNPKKLRSGMVTDEFADNLILASDNVFCKKQADAFSSEELISYLKSKGVSEIEMLGVSNLPRFEKTKEDLEKIGIILK